MTGSFLDTTVVVHIAERIKPGGTKGEAYIRTNQPAETPYYALRELLDGRVRIFCNVHNALYTAENPGEAMLALQRISPAEGRKRQSKLEVFATSMNAAFAAPGDRNDVKREMLQDLALRANNLWRKAHKLKSVTIVQALGCFNDGKVTYDPDGALRGPRNSFTCIKSERCSAAAYIYDDKSNLTKMISALHPSSLDPKIANKNETQKRRKALKELQANGPANFDKGRCRALGDAYFAAMCPAGSVVLTSNLEDHVPLCLALGKKANEP
ncbi:MAG: hypothetical protein NUV63_11800 [Gallionella sp.]|nr:hypothetical protein [Gallionella sp.]